jgi:hypothetical protein
LDALLLDRTDGRPIHLNNDTAAQLVVGIDGARIALMIHAFIGRRATQTSSRC